MASSPKIVDALTAGYAVTRLQQLGSLIRKDLENRMALGKLLIEIREQELWNDLESHRKYGTWTDFLNCWFPLLTGLRISMAYDAISLAESKVLASIPPGERQHITAANARQLVAMERTGQSVTPQVIESAKTLDLDGLRQATGATRGFTVSKWVADAAAGESLQKILDGWGAAIDKRDAETLAGVFVVLHRTGLPLREIVDWLDSTVKELPEIKVGR
jgi:hypothetical protein